ncbi:MAG: MBL fold metallo-hydrolase [Gemmatimonadota bacterium]|nr:MAG: MBL fold metallo-hydrolase [Gemmatimonadota bacterium]
MAIRVCFFLLLCAGISPIAVGLPLTAQQDYSQVEITVTPVRGGVHMISGVGGNIAAFLGEDGVFLVDAGLAELAQRILDTIGELAQRESANPDIAYVVNTHWHFDHTGGNEAIAAQGAVVVAHENVLHLLSQDQVMAALGDREIQAAPASARPRLTFNDRVNLSWNGDLIHVVHIADAHSNGDAIVHFRDADVIHLGDIFFNGRYPFIDVDFGGHISGMVRAVDEILAHSNESTLFVPGHGALADRDELREYRDMLATVRDRVQEMIDRGMTREEVIEAKPTADLDAVWGDRDNSDFWVGLVYDGMVRSG